MNIETIYFITGFVLFGLGFLGLIVRSHPLHRLLAINIMGVGIFMWLITTGFNPNATDSVPHALVLTGIVVAVSATAFALALVLRMYIRSYTEEADHL